MAKEESDVCGAILDWLKGRGIEAWRNHTQGLRFTSGRGRNPAKGKADIQGILVGGLSLQIEVKKPKGVRSPEQIEFIAKAADLGAVAFFAESLDDVIREFSLLESA